MSLVVTSNVNISIDQALATTMSLVVKSNLNISIDQALATTMSLVVRANVIISVDQVLSHYYVTYTYLQIYCRHFPHWHVEILHPFIIQLLQVVFFVKWLQVVRSRG